MKKKLACLIISFAFAISCLLSSCSKVLRTAASSGVDMKLSIALDGDCLEAIKEAIDDGADLNHTAWSYYTEIAEDDNNPVSMCISRGKEDIACILVESGADPNYNVGGHSLLTYAISSGQLKLAKTLVEYGADVNYIFNDGDDVKSPLDILLDSSRFDKPVQEDFASFLLENSYDISQVNLDMFIFNTGAQSFDLSAPQTYDLSVIRSVAKHAINKNEYHTISPMEEILLGDCEAALDYLSNGDTLKDFPDLESEQYSVMLYAAAFGNTELIDRLLSLGIELDPAMLSAAARYNTPEVVKFLVDNGAAVSNSTSTPSSAEYASIFNPNTETTKYVASLSSPDRVPLDYFISACSVGNAEYINQRSELIKALTDDDKYNLIINAGLGGSAEVFKALKNAEISDFTPALTMSAYMSQEAISYILDSGTDINAPKTSIDSALYSAIRYGDLDKVKFLVEAGAKINPGFHDNDISDPTPLLTAVELGRLDIAEYLLENGADTEAANSSGYTPLLYAVDSLSYNMAQLLLEYNADKTARTNDGMTAYDLAQSNYYTVEDEKMLELFE